VATSTLIGGLTAQRSASLYADGTLPVVVSVGVSGLRDISGSG
jgi:hypothetical protein